MNKRIRCTASEAPMSQLDLDAEAAVLSSLLALGENDTTMAPWAASEIWEAIGGLGPEMLYSEANRRILEAIHALDFDGQQFGVVAVAGWLRDCDRLAQVGGPSYLAALIGGVPTAGPTALAQHAARIEELWRLRRIAEVAAYVRCEAIAGDGRGCRERVRELAEICEVGT